MIILRDLWYYVRKPGNFKSNIYAIFSYGNKN